MIGFIVAALVQAWMAWEWYRIRRPRAAQDEMD
jgi:hypothetical protein